MFEVINTTKQEIKEIDIIKKVLLLAIQKEQLKNICFNVIMVDNEYIRQLNKQYRKKDYPTDVITFALEDEKENIVLPVRILGDIYISVEQAEKQAKEFQHSITREFAFLGVHGFYHLLGYDHQTKEEERTMFQKQEEVLDEAGIKR